MTPSSAAPRVLCVDDEPGILRAIRRILRSESVEVVTAGSGPDALSLLREQAVDLILTDYRMPEMTGVEFLEHSMALCPDAFRIILTGYAEASALIEAINRGQIYKIVYKPFQEEDVKLTVRSALEHYARNQENALLTKRLAEQNQQLELLNRRLEQALAGTTRDLNVSVTALNATQQLVDQLDIAILAVDPGGQIVLANRRADEWFSALAASSPASEPLLGSWATERLPPMLADMIERTLQGPVVNRTPPFLLTLNDLLTVRVRCRTMSDVGVLLYADDVQFSSADVPS